MAQNAVLTSLSEQLVASLAASKPTVLEPCPPPQILTLTKSSQVKPAELRQAKDGAVRAFKAQHYARTNQFDVQDSLNGLLEKFEILYREDLAEALQARLSRLKGIPNKWTPEILSLLLQLSDRPLEKTRIGSLALLRSAEETRQLTWSDIVADESIHQGDESGEIDYRALGSSDDDALESESDQSIVLTAATSDIDEPIVVPAHAFRVAPDLDGLDRLRETRSTLDIDKQLRHGLPDRRPELPQEPAISEFAIIRESLFMIRGLPTSLFQLDTKTGRYRYTRQNHLSQASGASTISLLSELAELATSLHSLREWVARPQARPVLQALNAATSRLLHAFEEKLSGFESQFTQPDHDVVLSVLRVTDDVRSWSTTLIEIQQMVSEILPASPHHCLELLFDRLCLAQLTAQRGCYEQLGEVFFACLDRYLRPVRAWMMEGELPQDERDFFVRAVLDERVRDGSRVQRFIINFEGGRADAPRFMQTSCDRIFKAGKSVHFLKSIKANEGVATHVTTGPQLGFESICGASSPSGLMPFSEALDFALDVWVKGHHTPSTRLVRHLLVEDFGLWHHLDLIDLIYFGRDGARTQMFAGNIMDKLEKPSRFWNDRFVLTELLQTVFSGVTHSSVGAVSIRTLPVKRRASRLQSLATLVVVYPVPQPLLHIIQRPSLVVFQKVFTLNLQLRFIRHLLSRVPERISLRQGRTSSRSIDVLRFHMLRFSASLHAHFYGTVIEPLTRRLRLDLANGEDIDAMATIHETYVKSLETRMLLGKNVKPIRMAITQMLELCAAFCEALALHQKADDVKTDVNDAAARHRRRRSVLPATHAAGQSDLDNDSDDGDDAEENVESDYDADVDNEAAFTGPFHEKARKIAREFYKLNNFTINGLKALTAAGGEACHETLAERLE